MCVCVYMCACVCACLCDRACVCVCACLRSGYHCFAFLLFEYLMLALSNHLCLKHENEFNWLTLNVRMTLLKKLNMLMIARP